MKAFFIWLALAVSFIIPSTASAAVVVSEGFGDSSYLSNCVTDRYAPTSVGSVGGELALTVSGGPRAAGFGSAFYATQGIKCAAPAGIIKASVDIFADSAWLALAGSRRGGFWAAGEDSDDEISAYPIMEVYSTGGQLRLQNWNLTGAFVGGAVLTVDTWHRLTMEIDVVNDDINYYLGNALVGSYDANGTTSFRDVMFQNINPCSTSDLACTQTVRFDDLVLETADRGNNVPEPSTLALASLSLMGLGFIGRRRQRTAAPLAS